MSEHMFVMRARSREQELAREMRASGASLNEIVREFGVAKSSASVWVRDVPKGITAESERRRRPVDTAGLTSVPVVPDASDLQRCSRCRLHKPLAAYNRNKTGRQAYCRPCFQEYFRARGQKHRDQSGTAQAKRRAKARKLVAERLASGCVDCHERDPVVLEFDHVREKGGEIARLVRSGSLKRLRHELEACEVVCVNCHRRRTYGRMGRCWRTNPRSLETEPGLSTPARRNLIFIRGWLTISPCCDCGERDLAVLEFDHLRDKCGAPVTMARRECSLERLRGEVAKCEVRCGNCHRRRTLSLASAVGPAA